ncbi:phenylacetic acid degradation protein PaaD [Lachnospiraceae bacterium MD335]|nr:phenylacetic acid degradation protein PaaD [Lachnospiraceae bacterium MD335]
MVSEMERQKLDEVRERFLHDRFATVNGAVIEEIAEGYAKCSMQINNDHKNALGAVMGGAIFTLADFAFAVAANWQEQPVVSLDASITFLGKAKGNILIAEAKKIRAGRRTCCYMVEITDELGSQVAHMTSNGFAV